MPHPISNKRPFQSTLPREERHRPATSLRFSHYFNPRSHERSDDLADHFVAVMVISIHAPTRGATPVAASFPADPLFQSTLPREERHDHSIQGFNRGDFNPRSHERSDKTANGILIVALEFQSTLPREERPNDDCTKLSNSSFQSTLPREERHVCHGGLCSNGTYFNPRSHERSDGGGTMRFFSYGHFNPRSHERSDILPGRC